MPKEQLLNNDHGRLEKRRYQVITDLKWIENQADWVGLQTIVKVESTICYKVTAQTSTEVRYYISSLPVVNKQKDILGIVQGGRATFYCPRCQRR